MNKKNTYETIILGGGVSGLGAARTLSENSYSDFLVISQDIGGRVINNNGVNYGAYFATHQYKHLKKFMTFNKELKKTDVQFHRKGKEYRFLSFHFMSVLGQYIKCVIEMKKFRRMYDKFKKDSEIYGQKKAVEMQPKLHKFCHENAMTWVNRHGLRKLVDDFASEPLYSLTFTAPSEMNSFFFLQWSSEIYTNRVYEFSIDWDMMIKPFKEKMIQDSIVSIKQKEGIYEIKTKKQLYYAKKVICALPYWVSNKLFDLGHDFINISAYMHHVRGKLHPRWTHNRMNVFSSGSQSFAIAEQKDGTFILYTRHKDIDFRRYFTDYHIIAEKSWEPAFANPHELIEFKQSDSLYIIGDFNFPGMEDSYISGIYAANQLLKRE